MFRDLPEFVQKQVLNYLANDNFSGAKALHDAWIRNQARHPTSSHHHSHHADKETIIAPNVLLQQKINLIERILNKTETD